MQMTKTKIVVTTPKGQILTYLVDEYGVIDGFLFLYDQKNTKKGFPVSWCELTGVE